MTQQDDEDWNNTVSNPQLEGFDPTVGRGGELSEDNDSPTTPADDIPSALPPDHPAMDSGLDTQEMYDAGESVSSSTPSQDETGEDKSQALNSPS